MRKLFNSQFKVTQAFGVNPEYYKQFGLKGHEGLDLIPTGSVWDVYALEDGVVVFDDDAVGSVSADPYGKIVALWHPTIKKATIYCHLAENYVSYGQTIKRGEKIGKMGSTGNSTGAHVHLNLFETDENGVRLNRDNGYLGGIDPLPFLNEDPAIIAQPIAHDKTDQIKRAYKALTGEWVKQEEIEPWIKRDLSLDDTMIEIMKGDGRFFNLWIKPVLEKLEEDLKTAKAHIEEFKKQNPQPSLKKDEVIEETIKTYPVKPKNPPVSLDPVFSGQLVNLLQFLKKKLGF